MIGGINSGDAASILTGIINFGNNIGYSDFTVFVDGKRMLYVRIEVYPSKISYKDDYQAMMSDINAIVSESVMAFMKKTYQDFRPNNKRNAVPVVFFEILNYIYDKYLQAAKRIIAVPHHKLVTEHEVMPAHKAKRVDQRSQRWLLNHPKYVRMNGSVIQADRVLAVRKMVTYDTNENQLVKYMIQKTIWRMQDFTKRYVNTTKNPDQDLLAKTRRMERELRRLITSTFLAEVSDYRAAQSMSLVFGMAPGYQELYKYYLMLQNGISVGGEIFKMSMKETAQLYEYWCFIKLYTILRDKYELKSRDIIKVDRKGVTVNLETGKESRVKFVNPKTGEAIFLAYNPSESRTQTVNQRPDNVLELEKRGIGEASDQPNYKYVFDAKYRVEMNPADPFYPDDKPGPKVDDINTMHRYRDAIVYENTKSRFTFEKTMFGAYILFPYKDEEEYARGEHAQKGGAGNTAIGHRFYRSIDSVNIGGLPFLPSATELVTKLLDELVTDSADSAFERATLPVGIEERLKTVDWERKDVLVGVVEDAAQLAEFLSDQVYRTRCFNRDRLPIRYVALYEKGKGIRTYGEVKYWMPVEDEDGQIVHEFHVVEWTKLKELIKVGADEPGGEEYTNHFLLTHSTSFAELRMQSEKLYREFIERRRKNGDGSYMVEK